MLSQVEVRWRLSERVVEPLTMGAHLERPTTAFRAVRDPPAFDAGWRRHRRGPSDCKPGRGWTERDWKPRFPPRREAARSGELLPTATRILLDIPAIALDDGVIWPSAVRRWRMNR